jgi:competence ComEA-like helix-hairpin-helix protein
MHVDRVRNLVLVAMIVTATAVAVAMDVRDRATRPRAVGPGEPCPIPEQASSPATRSLFCTGRMDINAADAEDLELLRGVGPSLSRALALHRERHGPYRGPDDLEKVSGIGPVTARKIARQVVFESPGLGDPVIVQGE